MSKTLYDKIWEEHLDLAGECARRATTIWLARGQSRKHNIVSTHLAGIEHVVATSGYGEVSIVDFAEETQGGTRLDLQGGNPCYRVKRWVKGRHRW